MIRQSQREQQGEAVLANKQLESIMLVSSLSVTSNSKMVETVFCRNTTGLVQENNNFGVDERPQTLDIVPVVVPEDCIIR
jgi:hypothetical protein